MTKDEIKAQAKDRLAQVAAIADTAAKAGRDFTDDERKRVDALMGEARDLKTQYEQAKADEFAVTRQPTMTLEQFLGKADSGYGTYGAHEWAMSVIGEMTKAGHTSVKALVGTSIDVPQVVATEVVTTPQPRRVMDTLVNRQGLSGNEFEYLRQSVRVNNADVVADNALKPTSVFSVAPVTDRARVVAHLSEPVPVRLLDDHAELRRFLESEMNEGVLQALEAEVLSGDGTGEHMTGILNTSGLVSIPFATDVVTTVRKAMTDRQKLNEVPTAWIVNPDDLETFDLLKDAQNRYYGDALSTFFGDLPKVASTGIPAGTALLGDFRQSRLYVREDLRLDADQSGDLFKHNQVQLRAEGRFGFAVLRPQAFAIVDLTAA